MIPVKLYVERARSAFQNKKQHARVGKIASGVIDIVGLLCGLFLLYASSNPAAVGIGLFLIIFGGWGVVTRLYHLIYSAIVRALGFVVEDEVVEE